MWIVGEGFLKSSFATLQTMKTSLDSQNWPYIYQHFQIKPFYQTGSGSAVGTIHKLYNSLVEALNKSHILPHYILVIPDRDIILQLDFFALGIGFIIEQMMEWLFKQVDHLIEAKCDFLHSKCIGALLHMPTILWTHMINRPLINCHPYNMYNLVVELRAKFNRTINVEVRKSHFSRILHAPNDAELPDYFDNFGNLTFQGKQEFWIFIDDQIARIDKYNDGGESRGNDTSTLPPNGYRHFNRGDGHFQPSHQDSAGQSYSSSRQTYNTERQNILHSQNIWGEVGKSINSHFCK